MPKHAQEQERLKHDGTPEIGTTPGTAVPDAGPGGGNGRAWRQGRGSTMPLEQTYSSGFA